MSLTLDQLQRLQANPADISRCLLQILGCMAEADEEVRAWAADCLQELTEVNEAQAREIASMLSHPCEYVVYWACQTLAKAESVERFQDQLVQLLNHHASYGVKQSAAGALCHVSRASPSTRSALEEAAKSRDARLSRIAKEALRRI